MISETTAPHRSMARAALIVMLLFVASRVLGLLRDVVISHQFGTARALDAYFAAFTIPDFIFNVLAGGALGSAFIPTFAAALANDAHRAWRLARAIIALTFFLMTALAIVLAIFSPPLVAIAVAPGFTPADQELTATLMRAMLLTPIVFGVSGIIMGILNAHQHFILPALAPALYNAAIIAGALWLAPTLGIYGLVVGVVAGSILHLAIQLPWFLRFQISDFRFQNLKFEILNLKSYDVREVAHLFLPRTLGIAAVQINFVVNTILASTLPIGSIAALGYAWRVMLLPVGVIGQSLATVVFPTLSAQTARQERAAFRATFSIALRATLYLTIPASVGLFILGAPFIALLFQRGQFTARSTADTAFALQFFALGLFAHSALEIITRAFYALHDTRTPVIVGIGAMALNVALSIALIAPLAHGGLALANSIATILETLTLLAILHRRLGDIDARQIAISTARILAASLVMTIALIAITNLLASSGAIIIAIIGGALGAIVYLVATIILRADEIAFIIARVNRKS
ncbi:MAG: murein biosynthesis integral membrane protein MurJ [Chloroflexi bacterium]|nr:murein biosynthesis integral membrane protein MurJ [Chloroflexota bacterium]